MNSEAAWSKVRLFEVSGSRNNPAFFGISRTPPWMTTSFVLAAKRASLSRRKIAASFMEAMTRSVIDFGSASSYSLLSSRRPGSSVMAVSEVSRGM